MNLSMQAKLLRVIQEKEITPVGSDQSIKTDVRIIAATNKDLKKRSEKGLFRQDLFYRLNVVNIEIPPLRHRLEDIPEMALHFLKRFSKQNKRDIKGFNSQCLGCDDTPQMAGECPGIDELCGKSRCPFQI